MIAELVIPIKVGNQNKKDTYPLVSDETKIGSSDICNIKINGLDPHHITLVERNQKHYITEVLGTAFINNKELPIGKNNIELKPSSIIMCNKKRRGIPIIYKNHILKELENPNMKIGMANDHFGFTIPKRISKINSSFFSECPTQNKSEFAKYLINFLFQNFPVKRSVLYEVTNNELNWKPVFSRAPQSFLKVSRTLIQAVKKKREAIIFDPSDNTYNSMSIVQQKIQKAFVFPVIYKGKIIAALYIDTVDIKNPSESLTKDDFIIIASLVPGISASLRAISFSEKELAKNRMIEKNMSAALIENFKPLLFRGMISDSRMFYYKNYHGGRIFSYVEIEAELTIRYMASGYLKYMLEYDHHQCKSCHNSFKNFTKQIPGNIKTESLESCFISIDTEKNIYASVDNKIHALLLPIYGDVIDLKNVNKYKESSEGEYIIILSSNQKVDDLKKVLSSMNQDDRNDKKIKEICNKFCSSISLIRVE